MKPRTADHPIIHLFYFGLWRLLQGDKTLRLNHELGTDSLVFDVGGYQGEWAQQIFNRYQCRIMVFEPVPEFYQQIKKRFDGNSKIRVFNFGLGNYTHNTTFNQLADASGQFQASEQTITVPIRDIVDFIKEEKVMHIDLMKINIEGGEYDLLDRLITAGDIEKVHTLQVQFHSFVPHAKERRAKIMNRLAKNFQCIYHFPFIWGQWEKLSNKS